MESIPSGMGIYTHLQLFQVVLVLPEETISVHHRFQSLQCQIVFRPTPPLTYSVHALHMAHCARMY